MAVVDESLLASLLLVLQQLPSLLTSPPRSDAVPKVREGLSQARRLLAWKQTLLLPHTCANKANSNGPRLQPEEVLDVQIGFWDLLLHRRL